MTTFYETINFEESKELEMASIETLKIEITPDTMIPELLEAHPPLRPIFDRYGLHGCGGERGPAETLKFFARAHGVDQELLLQELRQGAEKPSAMVGTEAVGAQAGQAEGVLIEELNEALTKTHIISD